MPFTSGGNRGFHTLVQFPTVQATDPSVTGTESVVYPKAGPTDAELFFRNAANIFQLTNLPPVNGTITGVTSGANTTITSVAHGLASTNAVTIRDVGGVTGINGVTFGSITVTGVDTFELNGASAGVYLANTGTWTSPASTRYGFFTPWGWIVNTGTFAASNGTNTIEYSIPLISGFTFYTGLLTPFTGQNKFALLGTGTQTSIDFSASTAASFNYLFIGSGT